MKVITVADGKVDEALLLGLGVGTEDDIANRRTRHDAEAEHDHDDFDSFVVPLGEIADPAALAARVAGLAENFDVLRVKGFAAVADKPLRLLVQAVGAAGHASIRPAVGCRRGARRPARGDRTEGTRSRRGDPRARAIWQTRLSDAPADDEFDRASTKSSKRSISASRRATSRCCRLPTATSPALAAAWEAERAALPSVRLAHLRDLRHPMSVDLWIDRVGAHAKVIVVRLLGGLDWWKYGIERLSALARERGIALAVLPGEDRDDARLAAASTLPPPELDTLLRFFREGGRENLRALLRRLARHAGHDLDARASPQPVPRLAGYLPGEGAVDLDRLAATLAARQAGRADHLLSRHAACGRYRADRRALRGADGARPSAGAARRHQLEGSRRRPPSCATLSRGSIPL